MKLQELAVSDPALQAAKVFENYFGTRITFDQISSRQARQLLNRVRGLMQEHKQSVSHHFSERDPAYLKLVMMETALASRVREQMVPIAGAATQAAAAKPTSTTTPNKPAANNGSVDVKDPKLAAALKKSQSGQSLTPDEQKLVAGAALMQQESRLRRFHRTLKESEVQQAQVVLAAQDLVDKMQSMLEDTTEMQFKELPALVDSIRNQIGMDQANQFNTDATAALTGLVQNLQGAKQQMEAALGVVTGQQQATPALDAALTAGGAGAVPPMGAADDLDMQVDTEVDMDEPEEQPAGNKSALGRSRR
jgi:hypothetical protein